MGNHVLGVLERGARMKQVIEIEDVVVCAVVGRMVAS